MVFILVYRSFFVIIIYGIFKYYENYLKHILNGASAYKFSEDINLTRRIFWDIFLEKIQGRYSKIIFHSLFYSFPLILIFIKSLIKESKGMTLSIISIVSFSIIVFLFKNEEFQMPNVFINMSLGAETFYQTLKGTDDGYGHTHSLVFNQVVLVLKYLFPTITLTAMIMFLLNLKKIKEKGKIFKPEIIFVVSVFFTYVFMIVITESFFDRYHIPIITLSLIFFSYLYLNYKPDYLLVIIPMICFFYVSVFGTKDYLSLHRTTWQAYSDLREVKHVKSSEINAGFEICNWNEGEKSWWWDFSDIKRFNYIIQYDKEPGFKLLRDYQFSEVLSL